MKKLLVALTVFLALPILAEDVGPFYHGRMPVHENLNVGTAGNTVYNVVQKSSFPMTIKSATFRCASGTIHASVAINGADVTGCGGETSGYTSVSSTAATSGTCRSNNVLAKGGTLSIATDTNSSCLDFSASIDAVR